MIIAPCINCEKKGCGSYHDICEKYKEFRKQKDAILEIKHKESAAMPTYEDYKRNKTSKETLFKCHKRRE